MEGPESVEICEHQNQQKIKNVNEYRIKIN